MKERMRRKRIYSLYGYWEPDRYGNLRYVRYKDPISLEKRGMDNLFYRQKRNQADRDWDEFMREAENL